MDEGSERKFWSVVSNFFKKNGLEEHIQEALDDGEIVREDVSMLTNILNLKERLVREVMIPRPDVQCASADQELREVVEIITRGGHSRIPIYEGDKDHIVGIVHAKDALPHLIAPDEHPGDVRAIMRAPFFISENTNIKTLLRQFQTGKTHLAVAVDEYGGTSGIVTMEDVLEEIVGEIEDEYDTMRPEDVQPLEGGGFSAMGRMPLRELSERTGLELESDQVETIGGFVSELAGRIPRPGEFFIQDGLKFTVRDADPKQVRSVLIEPADEQD